jgi:hypothetical protein
MWRSHEYDIESVVRALNLAIQCLKLIQRDNALDPEKWIVAKCHTRTQLMEQIVLDILKARTALHEVNRICLQLPKDLEEKIIDPID